MNKIERHALALEYNELSRAAKALENRRKEINETLTASLGRLVNTKEVYEDGVTCTVVEKGNTSLDTSLLAANLGLTVEAVEAALKASRVETSRSTYVIVKG